MEEKVVIELKERMSKTLDSMHKEFATIRTGRANASILDRVVVEYFGYPTPLNEIAQISTPEPRQIMIKPYEKDALKMIEKALLAANIGLMPNNDGSVIRLTVPPLTEDRRKELCKVVAKTSENTKVALRNLRRDANESIKKDKAMPEDKRKKLENEIQKATDEFIKKIDDAAKVKEKDIMVV